MIRVMEMMLMMMMTLLWTVMTDDEGNDDDSDGSSLLLSPDHHETSPFSCFFLLFYDCDPFITFPRPPPFPLLSFLKP